MLTSAFLLLSHGTLQPAGGGSAPAAVDGGGVASPGCPPACTCATLASRWTARHCGSPGARPLGRPPGGPCAVYTRLPPASSPASQGPSGTPSRRLRGPRGQAAADPRVWAGGPLSTSCTLTDPEPTRARDPVPSQLRKSPPAAEGPKPQVGALELLGPAQPSRVSPLPDSCLTKHFTRHFLPGSPGLCGLGWVGVSGRPCRSLHSPLPAPST